MECFRAALLLTDNSIIEESDDMMLDTFNFSNFFTNLEIGAQKVWTKVISLILSNYHLFAPCNRLGIGEQKARNSLVV